MGRGQWISWNEPQIVAAFPWLQTSHWDHSGLFCFGERQHPISFTFSSELQHRSQAAGSSPYAVLLFLNWSPSSGERLTAPFDWLLTLMLGLLSSSLLTLKDDYFSSLETLPPPAGTSRWFKRWACRNSVTFKQEIAQNQWTQVKLYMTCLSLCLGSIPSPLCQIRDFMSPSEGLGLPGKLRSNSQHDFSVNSLYQYYTSNRPRMKPFGHRVSSSRAKAVWTET